MSPSKDAVLIAIELVNSNVLATREEVSQLRSEMNERLNKQDEEIEAMKIEAATKKGWKMGFKAPIAVAGMGMGFVVEHAPKLIEWIPWFRKL